MTAKSVLIASYSGRALAASARRAGYVPLVVDAYGDTDTREAAAAVRCLSDAIEHGFRAAPLLGTLAEIASANGDEPIGLILGAGFEDTPGLIETLAQHYTLLGCTPETVRRCSEPKDLFGLLAHMGIPHPETSLTPPADGAGWLSKLAGGSGGTHIARCSRHPTAMPHRYFQRAVAGEGISISAMGITSDKGAAFAFSRQWVNPAPRRPYRYGGAVGNIEIDTDLEARLVDTMLALCDALKLTGLVSFDFLVDGGEPMLVDVNPRPGAMLDVLDDAKGTLFKAHLAAVAGEDPIDVLQDGWAPATVAAAYLYADRGTLTVPAIAWPDWAADRPAPGAVIEHHTPLATVIAEAASPEAAEALCRERLSALEQMLYQSQNLEDASS